MENKNEREHEITYAINQKPQRKRTKTVLVLFLTLLFIGSNCFTYFVLARYLPVFTGNKIIIDADDTVAASNINKLLYFYDTLNNNYLWETDAQKLFDGALHGFMEATGDPYTLYMDAKEYSVFRDNNAASYSGIGVQFSNNEDNDIVITKVFNASPALDAGLRAGDVIVSADETSLRNTNINIAVTYVRGEAGTNVKLGVERDGEIFYVDIMRATVETVYCDYRMLDDNIGYIHIYEFEANTYTQFKEGLDKLTSDGMKGLILDLRQNPGGAVNQAIKVVDELLPECEVIYTMDGNGKKEYYYSSAGCINVPLTVLVDEYSASSSEIVASSIKDNHAGAIVGKTSYGKGIMQMTLPLSDGTYYQYTFCEYFAPSGTKIHKVGVTPDYEAEKGDEYQYYLVENIPGGEDIQLNTAIKVIEDLSQQ